VSYRADQEPPRWITSLRGWTFQRLDRENPLTAGEVQAYAGFTPHSVAVSWAAKEPERRISVRPLPKCRSARFAPFLLLVVPQGRTDHVVRSLRLAVPKRRTGRLAPSLLLVAIVLLGYSTSVPTAAPSGPAPEAACPTDCNDFNACTIDSCDTTTGTCRHVPRSCDDHNPCTNDLCFSSTTGGCAHVPVTAGTACDDGSSCTTSDACNANGGCVGTPQAAGSPCDDGNSCTSSDQCNETGLCEGTAALPGTSCDDASLCTTNDTCVASPSGPPICQGTQKDCGDGNLCTQDLCAPATGECSHPPVDCNDGNSCTSDTCDAATGSCAHAPVSGSCSDGNLCTINDFCSGGNCLGGGTNPCADLIPCTRDFCEVFTQNCRHDFDNSLCPADTPCATWRCTGSTQPGTIGGCSGFLTPGPWECDGNPCTNDLCTQTGHMCIGGGSAGFKTGPCDDHNPCTVGDHCTGTSSLCVGSPACDDANPCTSDSCNQSTGACSHTNNSNPCSDGNPCTVGDVCSNGTCQAGGSTTCDDANFCTADTCNADGTCGHTAISCDDGNPCTADGCDAVSGCIHQVQSLPETCGVGACRHTMDVCAGGVPQPCVPGSPVPETCNGIDDDCDGLVDEDAIVATCTANPSTLNLNSQGSIFSLTCKLSNGCDPANPVPISGSTVSQVYISRLDSADDPSDDVTLPDPSTLPCPDPVLGSLYERGISENLAARDVSSANVTFKFNLPADGQCSTLDGDRQDIAAKLAAVPDGTSATLCIAGKTGGLDFQGCVLIQVKNKGLR